MAFVGQNNDLIACRYCERNFNPESLDRHEPICKKAQQKKRKVFDSSKQRVEGTELATVKKRGGPSKPELPQKKNNWRQKHEDFVRTIRAARGVQAAMERGEPLPPPPPPTINPDYVQCEYCGRRFNESAAQRHVIFCKEQHERVPKKKPEQMTAAQKMAVRTQYQPPKLKKPTEMTSQLPVAAARGRNYSDNKYTSGAAPRQRSVGSGRRGTRDGGFVSSERSNRSNFEEPGSGHALRTGRTVETYSEARQLSAKQMASVPTRRYPSSDSIHSYNGQYTGTGYVPTSTSGYRGMSKPASRPLSGEDDSLQYGTSYGYGSPGTVPRGRGALGGVRRQSNGSVNNVPPPAAHNAAPSSASKFCYDCGARYPVTTARFCCECGARKA